MSDTTIIERPIIRPYHGAYKNESDTDATQVQNPDATPKDPSATPETSPDLNPEERTYKIRYDSLKAHYDRTIIEARAKEAELKSQIVTASSHNMSMPKTVEELDNWRKAYPDLYGMFITTIRQELKAQETALNARVGQVEEMAQRATQERAEAVLLRLHPDFPELRISQEFHDWVKEQPKTIQDGLYENANDPLLASRVIDLYKADKGLKKAPAKAKQNLNSAAQAVVVNNRVADLDTAQGKQWKTSEIANLSRRDFDRFEEEIDKARREGRLILDK